ncbi:MAG: hypothetical protein NVSMB13_07820 [Mycobacteriales bacterium]
MIAPPLPTVTEVNAPYWEALAQGRLVYQRCAECGHAWLPAREDCPRCLSHGGEWVAAEGAATLVSWVVVHTAYHDYFADKLPYLVAVVQLAEGPRLISTVLGADPQELSIDAPLRLEIESGEGWARTVFRLAS